MHVLRSLILGISIALVLQAQDDAKAYKTIRLDEVTALVPKLQELAAWTGSVQLLRERDRLSELVLRFDEENAKARAALQYKRKPDGTWSRPPDWREGRNASEKAMPEYVSRRSALANPVAERLLDALNREKESMPAATRAIWFDELVALAPDCARLRDLLGEKRVGDRWVLTETASAAATRAEYVRFANGLRDEKRQIESEAPNDFEKGLKLTWSTVRRLPFVRVAATVPEVEADKILVMAEIAWRLVHRIVGAEPDPSKTPSVIVFKNAEQLLVYLGAHPETPDSCRTTLVADFTLGVSGNILVGAEDPPSRLLSARSRTASLAVQFGHRTSLLPGWVDEGFAVYVGALMTGRFEYYYGEVNPAGALGEFVKHAQNPKASWLEAAAEFARDPRSPTLARLLALDRFKMNSADSLLLGAFVGYLVEGRPAEVGPYMIALGRNPETAAREAIGIEVPDLDKRFRRWLQETTSPPAKR